jgi:hypothetical protein
MQLIIIYNAEMKTRATISKRILQLYAVEYFIMIPAAVFQLSTVASHTATVDSLFSINQSAK